MAGAYGGGSYGYYGSTSDYGTGPHEDWRPWDVVGYGKNGAAEYRDSRTDAQRLAGKAQQGLYDQDEWAKGVEGRDALSMKAASLGPYTPMGNASAGPGALAGYNTIDQTKADEARAMQMGLLGRLDQQSMGQGPSLATAMLKSGTDQGLQAQMAAAASQKGVGQSALAGRNLALAGASAQGQLAQQSAMARMQEQLSAQQQLGGLSSGVRAQDLGVAGQQAALNQQVALANQGATNQFSLANAGFLQQKYGADAAAANQYGLAQAGFQQGANQANLSAGLAQRSAGDAARQAAYNQTQGAWQTAAGIGSTDKNSAAARAQQQSQADTAERDKWLAAAGTAAIALSDEKEKSGIDDGDAGLKKMLASYGAAGGFDGGLGAFSAAALSKAGGSHATKPVPGLGGGANAKAKHDAEMDEFFGKGEWTPEPSASGGLKSALGGGGVGASKFGLDGAGASGWIYDKPAGMTDAQYYGPQPVAPAAAQPFPQIYGYQPSPAYEPSAPIPWANNQGGAPGSMPVLSDEKEKSGIGGGDASLRDMLAKAGTHSYVYKDPSAPGAGDGRYVSPMAQELEKSSIGKSMVLDGPEGKMVDYGKGLGAMLASEAMHEKRIAELEKRLGKNAKAA